jgi:putative zinc finger protein
MHFSNQHPTDDILEQYLFGSLPEPEVEQLEEHLLVCHTCVDAAEQLLIFVESLRHTLETTTPKARAAGRHPALQE